MTERVGEEVRAVQEQSMTYGVERRGMRGGVIRAADEKVGKEDGMRGQQTI